MRESIYMGVVGFRKENTQYVIKFINSNKKLAEQCKNQTAERIKSYCVQWALENDSMFGNRLIVELEDVYWKPVENFMKTVENPVDN